MNAPLLFLDLDGTLIGNRQTVDPEVFSKADELRSYGVKFSVCTGRTGYGYAAEIAKRLDGETPHIFEAGAHVTTFDEDLYISELSAKTVDALIACSERHDATLELYTTDGIFVSREHPWCREHAKVLDIRVSVANLREVAQSKSVLRGHWMASRDVRDAIVKEPFFGHVASASSPVLPNIYFASVTAEGVSKGTAVDIVKSHVDHEGTYAIGDTEGDIPMLDAVDHPLVVSNSDRSLLDRYRVISGVDDRGVLEVFDEILEKVAVEKM